jgi:ribosomal protein L6P/L9E
MLIFHKLKTTNLPFNFGVNEKDKIIYLKSKNSFLFDNISNFIFFNYSNNFIFFKNYSNIKNLLKSLIKSTTFLLKGGNQFFFFEFRIIGLGYKIFKVKTFFLKKVISLKLGYAHQIYYNVPSNINFFTGKRRILIYSNDWNSIKNVCKHLFFLKKLNQYKLKGLIPLKGLLKLKVKQKK